MVRWSFYVIKVLPATGVKENVFSDVALVATQVNGTSHHSRTSHPFRRSLPHFQTRVYTRAPALITW